MVVLEELEQVRAGFLKYTKKAFQKIPCLKEPQILDIGCGSGVPALELAKLSDGTITGIDIDQSCVDEFNRKIKQEGLANRVQALNLAFSELNFPDETFDALWSEGVIDGIDFEGELTTWYRLLKHGGYLVVHYQIEDAADAISQITKYGYLLVDTLSLPPDAWWTDFYKPLEEKMDTILQKYKNNPDALKLLKQYQREMESVKKNPCKFRTAFYILKKK
jgi:ubiquinone/menaquinone biosynthesis C-methylase UbiE